MHYRISRNGQLYGPYTLEDLKRYLASGNILTTDLARSEEMQEWRPVSQIMTNQASGEASGRTSGSETGGDPFPSQPYEAVQEASAKQASADPQTAQNAAPEYTNLGSAGSAYDPASSPYASPSARSVDQYEDAPNLNWGIYLLLALVTCTLFSKVFTVIQAAWLKRVQPNSNALVFYAGLYALWILSFFVDLGRSLSLIAHHGFPYTSPGRSLLTLLYFILLIVTRFVTSNSLEEHFNSREPVGLKLNPVMVFFFGGVYFQYHLNRINAIKQAARFNAGRAY